MTRYPVLIAALLGALIAFLLVSCDAIFGPGTDVACGEWPYRAIDATIPVRVVEEVYAADLYLFDTQETWFRSYTDLNPWIGFFQQGEPLEFVRNGYISNRHALVVTDADRFWTVQEELCD